MVNRGERQGKGILEFCWEYWNYNGIQFIFVHETNTTILYNTTIQYYTPINDFNLKLCKTLN